MLSLVAVMEVVYPVGADDEAFFVVVSLGVSPNIVYDSRVLPLRPPATPSPEVAAMQRDVEGWEVPNQKGRPHPNPRGGSHPAPNPRQIAVQEISSPSLVVSGEEAFVV